jgi:hypothetical protein
VAVALAKSCDDLQRSESAPVLLRGFSEGKAVLWGERIEHASER